MDSERGLSGQKLHVSKQRPTDDEVSTLVSDLSQRVEQLDGLIRCLTEQQYDFGKKLKQVDTLINQGNGVLIDEEDNKLDHLNSLTKLAEKTVAEAEKMAETIKKESEEKAKTEAIKIVASAEEKAQTEADRIINEAKQRARDAAAEEAQTILGGINEVKSVFEQAYQKVLSNLGNPEVADKSK